MLKLEPMMLKLEPMMLKLEPLLLKLEPMMLKLTPLSCLLFKLQRFTSKQLWTEPCGVRAELTQPKGYLQASKLGLMPSSSNFFSPRPEQAKPKRCLPTNKLGLMPSRSSFVLPRSEQAKPKRGLPLSKLGLMPSRSSFVLLRPEQAKPKRCLPTNKLGLMPSRSNFVSPRSEYQKVLIHSSNYLSMLSQRLTHTQSRNTTAQAHFAAEQLRSQDLAEQLCNTQAREAQGILHCSPLSKKLSFTPWLLH